MAPTTTEQATTTTDDCILNVNVGVLGHVDSGKTSLVKALSTLLSTAALDKSKQSRQRGMTLDLGFSCFLVDLPPHLKKEFNQYTKLQMTLVDCPGHASLIRTIIGGAQIIDMVLLVVDAYKGWQAQTTECLVLAELTSPHLVVALNKADLFSESEREIKLQEAETLVRQRLKTWSSRRFQDCPIVGISACVGGEKVAAIVDGGGEQQQQVAMSERKHETLGIDSLVEILRSKLPAPRRRHLLQSTTTTTKEADDPFLFSIDHCFALRGRGTILTGTVLSGTAKVNDLIEFPALAQTKKLKSMQMFHRSVEKVSQGDRAGLCVANLDAKLLERGICASPKSCPAWHAAIALIQKVPYYPHTLKSPSKVHISVGHATVMATVTVWGATELAAAMKKKQQSATITTTASSSLGGGADMAGLPCLEFDFEQSFLQQSELLEELTSSNGGNTKKPAEPLLHWALIEFQTPVYCPIHSLVIGSRLDTAIDNNTPSGSGSNKGTTTAAAAAADAALDVADVSSCRLAFAGRLIQPAKLPQDAQRLKLYTRKTKTGVISRLGDAHKRQDDGQIVRYEVYGSDLFKKETNFSIYEKMRVTVTTRKGVNNDGGDQVVTTDVGEIKSSFGTGGKFKAWFPAGTQAKEGDTLVLPFVKYVHDKRMHQDVNGALKLPAERPGTLLEAVAPVKKKTAVKLPHGVRKVGVVASLKGDLLPDNNGDKHSLAIVSDLFDPSINIKRDFVGQSVYIPSTKEWGVIVAPFGKAGKVKVEFAKGGISKSAQGQKAELKYQPPEAKAS